MANPERRFYFELALELGMTVGELLDRVSSFELAEWKAYSKMRAAEEERRNRRR